MEVSHVELLAGRVRQHFVVLLQNFMKSLQNQQAPRSALNNCQHIGTSLMRSSENADCYDRWRADNPMIVRTHQVVEVDILLQRQKLITNLLGFLQTKLFFG